MPESQFVSIRLPARIPPSSADMPNVPTISVVLDFWFMLDRWMKTRLGVLSPDLRQWADLAIQDSN